MPTRAGVKLAWAALAMAPVPLVVALWFTAKPVYHPDSCFYGASSAERATTAAYLDLMTPLGMLGLASAASVVAWLRVRRRWPVIALVVFAWAGATLLWHQAAVPVMYPGGLVALFGIFITPPLLAIVAVAASQYSWLKAVAWFQALYLLPVLLGLAKILAQPPCIP